MPGNLEAGPNSIPNKCACQGKNPYPATVSRPSEGAAGLAPGRRLRGTTDRPVRRPRHRPDVRRLGGRSRPGRSPQLEGRCRYRGSRGRPHQAMREPLRPRLRGSRSRSDARSEAVQKRMDGSSCWMLSPRERPSPGESDRPLKRWCRCWTVSAQAGDERVRTRVRPARAADSLRTALPPGGPGKAGSVRVACWHSGGTGQGYSRPCNHQPYRSGDEEETQ
jgi:hypothetical protein